MGATFCSQMESTMRGLEFGMKRRLRWQQPCTGATSEMEKSTAINSCSIYNVSNFLMILKIKDDLVTDLRHQRSLLKLMLACDGAKIIVAVTVTSDRGTRESKWNGERWKGSSGNRV
ncbi:hypothetical protein JCGZ_22740 [Jatropha curcas]|uniref:Uncharacterized protein n=1 Tax=Jatropha curcas TaxID=180498 RepID=A0A067L7J3_JATCU|nr:hypothetical protein JCGZ_22740 [Jatropha curcas]